MKQAARFVPQISKTLCQREVQRCQPKMIRMLHLLVVVTLHLHCFLSTVTNTIVTAQATAVGGSLVRMRGGGIPVVQSAANIRNPARRKNINDDSKEKPKQTNRKLIIIPSPLVTQKSLEDDDDERTQQRQQTRILLWIRLLFLSYYASLGSLMPYLPVYYDSLGHSGQIIGLLGAVKPFTTFIVAPIWGIISDSVNDPFTILSLTFVVSLAGQLSVVLRQDANYITFMVFVTALFNAPVKSLLDSLVMEILPPSMQGAAYGRLRLWGQLGFGLGSSGVGLLLSQQTSNAIQQPLLTPRWWIKLDSLPMVIVRLFNFFDNVWRNATSYRLLFLVHAILSIPTWMCIQTFRRLNKQKKLVSHISIAKPEDKVTRKETEKNGGVMKGLILLSRNADALLFFFLVFVVGTSSGVIENFAYVRMREVGGTGKEMGLSRLVSSVAGAPMFWFSGPLTQALGADRVLILSLCSYVLRFMIYAAMRNPYHGLPAEALRGVTFAAFWSTSTIYAHRVSPPGLHATMLMFLNAMYGGLGQSLGSVIGGKLQQRFGTVNTFCYAAVFDSLFVIFVVTYLYVLRGNTASGFKDPKPIQEPAITTSAPKTIRVKR